MEDEVLWAEQYDKSDTDSDEEGDNMYDDIMTHKQIQHMFSEESDDDFFLTNIHYTFKMMHGSSSKGIIG